MKTTGRPKSSNIIDRRTTALSGKRRGEVASFVMESYKAARTYKGKQSYNSFKK